MKTENFSNACGTATLKSLPSRSFFTPHVHPRPRKRLARCTLDCGFKTPESPALRGFEAERCPITGTSLYLVLKSNGLHCPKIRLKKFGFSPIDTPANIAKKLPPQRCFKPLLIALFNFSHKRLTFALTPESGYTLGLRRKIAHNGLHAETGAFLPSATAWLCAASEIHFIPPCFYIHTFPGSLWTTISNSSISDHLSSRFSTSRTNGPRSLSQAKVGTPGFAQRIAHKGLHAESRVFQMGVVSLPSDRSARFGNPAWPGGRAANFAVFGSWPGALPKNAESLRNSDALIRVAVPRRRGPAGLRDPVVRLLMLRFSVSVRKVSAQSPVNATRSFSHLNPSTTQPSSKNRTQGHTRRNRWCFLGGWYHYPRSVPHVSETLRGQGVERQTLPLLGLGRGCSRRTQKAFGTAMRLCVSLSRRRRGPAGLRDLFHF